MTLYCTYFNVLLEFGLHKKRNLYISESFSRKIQPRHSQLLARVLRMTHPQIYIYIYAFSRRFDLQCIQAIIFFISMYVPWELNPQPFVLLMQCSTTEPQEHKLN